MSSLDIWILLGCSRFIQGVLSWRTAVRRMRAVACPACTAGRQTEMVAVKYALTTLAAVSFGSLSFRISHLLGWNQFGERLLVFTGGLIAAAFICAPLWV